MDVRSTATLDVWKPIYVGRVPERVLRQLDEVARQRDRSRAAEIRIALAEHVRRSQTGDDEAA